MSKLETLQKEFIAKLFEYKAFPETLASDYPTERFNVYRHSIFENCRHALELTFPYLWQGLAEDGCISANEVAARFIQEGVNWPSSGCLDDWGGEFPSFLATISELDSALGTDWQGLARYEWFCHLANIASEAPKLSPSDLTRLSETEQMNLRFQFQPSFFIHTTSFPLGRFVKGLSEINSGWIVVIRSVEQIITYEIAKEWALFFKTLQDGSTITEAVELVLAEDSNFNFTAALTFLLQNNLCSSIY